jgi:DNA-binding winged helix-turn-helix (wHTH) protein/tetratricopeptide (TPR) repeat protein
MLFAFAEFIYDTRRQALLFNNKELSLTKKNHELLHYLLTHPQQLISRDMLIDTVWNGRVVTNNTIDQCVLKLRKVLNQCEPGEYIETVYGQGFRFIPAVSQPDEEAMPASTHHLSLKVFVLLLMVVAVWLVVNQQQTREALLQTTATPALDVVSQSALPRASEPANWLLAGGRNLLIHQLNGIEGLQAQQGRIADQGPGPARISFELWQEQSAMTQLEVMLQRPQEDDQLFQATVLIRWQDDVEASQQVQDPQLTGLFNAISNWVKQQLRPEAAMVIADSAVYTTEEFAMQSYFRAMAAQKTGDSDQAITYLQAATEQDPGFKMAWYELAIATRKQGDPRKAIAILEAIQTSDQQLAFRVALVKAQCLDSVGEFAAAEAGYQQALTWAEETRNPGNLAAVYISQGILYRKIRQFERAEQALELASQVTDPDAQPQLYGTIMNTHAKLAREMNQPLVAIDKAQAAIKAFQQSGDLRYQMQAKTVLASILRLRNEFSQAEQLVKESLFHAEQLNHRRGISDNRTKLARIYQQTGRFRLAHEQWQLVLQLNADLGLNGNTADAYVWLLQLHLAENNLDQADIDLKMLQQLYLEHPSQEISDLLNEASLIMAIRRADVELADLFLRELLLQEHPLLTMYQGDLARLRDKPAAAELHYLEALVVLHNSGRFDRLVTIMNRLNDLYTGFNPDKLNEQIQRTRMYQPFIYPLQKYQAQAAAAAGKHIEAVGLMTELKLKAGDFWQYEDQLLLEQLQQQSAASQAGES